MASKCDLVAEKFLQGRKKEPARSPEAKIVILAESSSKIWGGGLWAILTTWNPSPLPPRTAFEASVLYVSDCLVPKGLPTRRTWGSADFKGHAPSAADPEKKSVTLQLDSG